VREPDRPPGRQDCAEGCRFLALGRGQESGTGSAEKFAVREAWAAREKQEAETRQVQPCRAADDRRRYCGASQAVGIFGLVRET
jgi:hypothetical protein